MKWLLFATLAMLSLDVLPQASRTGIFANQSDVGNPKLTGSATFDPQTNKYILRGAGYNIWFARDEFFFLSDTVSGDFTATARFRFPSKGKNAHRKIGWMIRESLAADAAHAAATIHGDSLTVLQWRTKKAAEMRDPQDELFYQAKGNELITLKRVGNEISMWTAKEGQQPELVGSTAAAQLPAMAFVGIFICSHDPEVMEQAEVWDLHLTKAKN